MHIKKRHSLYIKLYILELYKKIKKVIEFCLSISLLFSYMDLLLNIGTVLYFLGKNIKTKIQQIFCENI